MNWSIIIRPEAENDLSESYNWYENQRFGLGNEYILRVEAALESIRYAPLVYACIYKKVRRILIRRFPYGIFYILNQKQKKIIVLAIMHVKRNPKRWKNRS